MEKILVNGTRTAIKGKITLKKMQDIVEGWIGLVHLPGKKVLVVNEEGFLKGLPVNATASQIASQTIVGNVIYATGQEIK